MRKQFLIKLFIKSIILVVLGIVLSLLAVKYAQIDHQFYFFLVPFAALLINLFSFFAASGNSANKKINLLISSLFGIKFFSYLILAITYLILEKNNTSRLIFVIYLFVIYILFTTILLSDTLKYLKSKDKTN